MRLYCTRDGSYAFNGTELKEFKAGQAYEIQDKMAENLLSVKSPRFLREVDYKVAKKAEGEFATKDYESKKKKVM